MPLRAFDAVKLPSPATSFGLSTILIEVDCVTVLPSPSKAISVVPRTSPVMSRPPAVPCVGDTATCSTALPLPV